MPLHEPGDHCATSLRIRGNKIRIELSDSKVFEVPVYRLNRLQEARREELENWRITEHGSVIQWPDLKESLPVSELFRRFGEAENRA